MTPQRSSVKINSHENSEWAAWHSTVLSKRNIVENVYQWDCGRPSALQDRTRDTDDDDYQDRDFDVAALANNLSQAFRYGIYSNDDMDEAHGTLERDDVNVYFDDESAKVVISSRHLGDDQDSGSVFTNSNWFAFEVDRNADERSTASLTSPSHITDGPNNIEGSGGDNLIVDEDDELVDAALPEPSMDRPFDDSTKTGDHETDKPPEWVEWRETSDSGDPSIALANGVLPVESLATEIEPMEVSSPSPPTAIATEQMLSGN